MLGIEVGFAALFLVGLALETSSAIALMVAGVLGILAVERTPRPGRKAKTP